jgi:PAS domain S-box-containing protein
LTTRANLRSSRPFVFLTAGAAIWSVLTGLSVMLGWILDQPVLKSVLPGLSPMKFNTALSFVLAGLSLLLIAGSRPRVWMRNLSRGFAFLIVAIGLLTAAEQIGGINLGIDGLLYHPANTSDALVNLDRMSLATAVDFILLGMAWLLLDRPGNRVTAQWLACLTAVVAGLALIGYGYDFKSLYSVGPFASMALHTALSLFLLSVGTLTARPDSGMVAVALRNYAAIGFGLALAILLVISAGTYHVTRQFIAANEWVTHTLRVNQSITEVFSSMQDLQAGVRGYVITGDEKFLTTRGPALAQCQAQLTALQTLLADNPAQLARLKQLQTAVEQRRAVAEDIVNTRRTQGAAAAAEAIRQAGLLHLEGLRPVVTKMQAEEESLLQQRTGDVQKAAALTMLGWCLGSAVSALILALVFLLLYRENNERKRTEQRFKDLLEAAPDASVIADEAGRIDLVNSQTETAFGYSRAELVGQSIEMLIPERERSRSPWQRGANGSPLPTRPAGADCELHGQRKDGTEFPIEISHSPLAIEGGWLVINSIRDISLRKRLELERDLFFNMSMDLLCIAGFDGYFKRLNPVWETVLGYPIAELMAQPFVDFIHPDDRVATLAKADAISHGDTAVSFENRYRCKDGSYRWLSWTAVPAVELARVFAVARDITAQKLAREEIEQLNRHLQAKTIQLEATNKELEAFSYSVSHDLRAPLRSIDGFTQVLQEDYAGQLDEEGRATMDRVRKATQRMSSLIDDMLALSRLSRATLHPVPVDLTAMAQVVAAELLQTDPARVVEFVIAPGLQAWGDVQLLNAMLENLLGNAWKFSSKKPRARIEFSATQSPGGPVVFFVSDDGAGFDLAYAGKLFHPFQRLHSTAEFPGTGVGLASVQRIVQRHGGRIWAEGAVGRGAKFSFTLAREN